MLMGVDLKKIANDPDNYSEPLQELLALIRLSQETGTPVEEVMESV